MTSIARTRFTFPSMCLAGVLLLVGGCAQQQIQEEATTRFREGKYEAALASLSEGVKRYPESAPLRSGLLSMRSEATARLVAEASRFRAVGRFDEAEQVLSRAGQMDPGNERVMAMRADVKNDRVIQRRLSEARALVAEGQLDAALQVVDKALNAYPRQPELQSMQRQLAAEQRLEERGGNALSLDETRPITLDFRNAPLSVVLDAITRNSGVNFVFDRDFRQDARVTVYLKSVPVQDALDLVAGAQQLAYRKVDGRTVLLYPNTPEKRREHEEQVIRVFHLSYADATATASLLRTMLKIKEPFVDERSNLIALRENPEIIALAERLVALHDVGDAEVMLDVEILEVKSTRLTELGINFPNSLALTPLPVSGASGLTVDSLRSINSGRVGVSVAGLLLNLRREVGDFNTLANPRIRAKNREKATILIGDKVPVITSTANSTGFVAESVNYLDVGLKLNVEPTVSPDDDVTIKLGLEVSSLTKEVRSPSGSLAYQIGTRNASTVLRLRDGETQLLAGLISNDDRSSANRVPGLGDLPIAGRLFSSQKDDVQRTELVLAITPRILRPAPRPEKRIAEMWVGSEQFTRLHPPPRRQQSSTSDKEGNPEASVREHKSGEETSQNQSMEKPQGVQLRWMAPSEVKAGESFAATLELASGENLRGVPLELSYSDKSLQVLDVAEGEFFRQSGESTSFTHAVNPTEGRIGIGILTNQTEGASGRGGLVRLQLKAREPGTAEVAISSFKLLGAGGMRDLADVPVLRLTVK